MERAKIFPVEKKGGEEKKRKGKMDGKKERNIEGTTTNEKRDTVHRLARHNRAGDGRKKVDRLRRIYEAERYFGPRKNRKLYPKKTQSRFRCSRPVDQSRQRLHLSPRLNRRDIVSNKENDTNR